MGILTANGIIGNLFRHFHVGVVLLTLFHIYHMNQIQVIHLNLNSLALNTSTSMGTAIRRALVDILTQGQNLCLVRISHHQVSLTWSFPLALNIMDMQQQDRNNPMMMTTTTWRLSNHNKAGFHFGGEFRFGESFPLPTWSYIHKKNTHFTLLNLCLK